MSLYIGSVVIASLYLHAEERERELHREPSAHPRSFTPKLFELYFERLCAL